MTCTSSDGGLPPTMTETRAEEVQVPALVLTPQRLERLRRQQFRIRPEHAAIARGPAVAVEKCYRCGAKWHAKSRFPFEKKPNRRWGAKHVCFHTQEEGHSYECCVSSGRCFVCGETGHLRVDCPLRTSGDP